MGFYLVLLVVDCIYIDASNLYLDYEEFLKGETRYKSLLAQDEDLAKELFEQSKQNAIDTYNHYKSLAEKCDF